MCLAAIFVTISCLFSHQAIIAIVNIIFVIVMAVGTYYIELELSRRQSYDNWGENPEYVGGTTRNIYEMMFKLSPYGHISEFVVFNMDWNGYDDIMSNPTRGMTGEEAWEHKIGDNVITEETLENFNTNIIYSCILLVLVSSIGYIGFRMKELK